MFNVLNVQCVCVHVDLVLFQSCRLHIQVKRANIAKDYPLWYWHEKFGFLLSQQNSMDSTFSTL